MSDYAGFCPEHGPLTVDDIDEGECGIRDARDEYLFCNLAATGPGADAALQAMRELDGLRSDKEHLAKELAWSIRKEADLRMKLQRIADRDCCESSIPGLAECTVHDGAKGCLGCQLRKVEAERDELRDSVDGLRMQLGDAHVKDDEK